MVGWTIWPTNKIAGRLADIKLVYSDNNNNTTKEKTPNLINLMELTSLMTNEYLIKQQFSNFLWTQPNKPTANQPTNQPVNQPASQLVGVSLIKLLLQQQ